MQLLGGRKGREGGGEGTVKEAAMAGGKDRERGREKGREEKGKTGRGKEIEGGETETEIDIEVVVCLVDETLETSGELAGVQFLPVKIIGVYTNVRVH